MRWTPFKHGRNDGWKRKHGWDDGTQSYYNYKGRQLHDYLSGLRQGIIRMTYALIAAETDPVNTITDIGELTGS